MKLIDLDAEQDYLLDGKYKVGGTGKPVIKTVHRVRDIIATEYRDDKGLLTRREVGEELVRCKDCKEYKIWGTDGTRICMRLGSYYGDTEPTDYCSYGERKEQENDKND